MFGVVLSIYSLFNKREQPFFHVSDDGWLLFGTFLEDFSEWATWVVPEHGKLRSIKLLDKSISLLSIAKFVVRRFHNGRCLAVLHQLSYMAIERGENLGTL